MKFLLAAAVALIAVPAAFGQATITIQNADPAGVGFNDSTAATPIGGNSGTTVGQQRLIAFQTAANIWGATLTSSNTITISASWADLPCTATSGALGSAGPTSSSAVTGTGSGMVPNRWYPIALAEALSNTNRNGSSAEISARFNQKLGQTGCLESLHWYYGLDNNHGNTGVDLVTVLLHEFGHGLGFLTFTNPGTGAFAGTAPNNFPSIWDDFLFDNTAGKTWAQMTSDSERVASATKYENLVWIGPQVTADVPRGVLSVVPRLHIDSPSAIAGNYQIGGANFGPRPTTSGTTAPVIQTIPNDACSVVNNSITGKIAFIDRGNCNFTVKVHNAQSAGALAVIIADNVSNPTPPGLGGGPDDTITIPTVSITLADGNSIKTQIGGGVSATLLSDKRAFLYTPTAVSQGSSVSHWETNLTPNQLMEPNNSNDLSHSVRTPQDLTLSLLQDIGWNINLNVPRAILTEQGATNAAAVDSVTSVRGPFTVTTANNFSADGRRRLIIFVTPELTSSQIQSLSVTANGIPLPVESSGPWMPLAGTSYIIVRLPDLQPNTDYALSLGGGLTSSNSPTIRIQ